MSEPTILLNVCYVEGQCGILLLKKNSCQIIFPYFEIFPSRFFRATYTIAYLCAFLILFLSFELFL